MALQQKMWSAVAAMAFFASPAQADLLRDWQQPKNQTDLHVAFGNLAVFCVRNYGFNELPAADDKLGRERINSYLHSSPRPDFEVKRWVELLNRSAIILTTYNGDVALGAKAVVSAVDDPSSYHRAERLYVETVLKDDSEDLGICTTAASDAFIGAHYFNGLGRSLMQEAKLVQAFADTVQAAKAKKTEPTPK